jgi:hypothetical protein
LGYPGSVPQALVLSGDGTKAYITGFSFGGMPTFLGGSGNDFATVSYAVSSGTQLWVNRYDAGVHGQDAASGIAVKPDGSSVFVTGSSDGPLRSGGNFLTIAYQG